MLSEDNTHTFKTAYLTFEKHEQTVLFSQSAQSGARVSGWSQ